MLNKRKKKKKNYKNRNEICEKIFLVLKRHRCIHSFQPKIPCLRQHKQAVTLHLDDRALGFPFLLKPSERGSCRKHHLLERKRDRGGRNRTKKGQGVRLGPAQLPPRAAAAGGRWPGSRGSKCPTAAPRPSGTATRPHGLAAHMRHSKAHPGHWSTAVTGTWPH